MYVEHSSFSPLATAPVIRFPVGTRLQRADRILPVFLPFAGCPRRCVFCAQDRQTGTISGSFENSALLQKTEALAAQIPPTQTIELAFYGGTFTSLPPLEAEACLHFYHLHHSNGKISCGRCSTRPDAVDTQVLTRLCETGLDMVELGVQSFHDAALELSGRGYDGQTALNGCLSVQKAGLSLGIQLLPGMPGVTPDIFLKDVDQALALRPACLRFYPCLVPEGTGLATLWRQGRYTPWTLAETVDTLAEGLRRAWAANIPVIRLAVAPEPIFDEALLAGPRHPALGSLIQAQALLTTVSALLAPCTTPPMALSLPRSCQGYLYGQHGRLRSAWVALGLPPALIHFTHEDDAALILNRDSAPPSAAS